MRIALFVAVAEELAHANVPPHAVVVVTGVGPVEAALAASRTLATGEYDLAVSCGLAGAYAGAAEVGDVVLVERVHFADLGREDGSPIALPPPATLIDAESCDDALLTRVGTRISDSVRGEGVCSATITTSDARAPGVSR